MESELYLCETYQKVRGYMSEICVYVKLPAYLKQWFVHAHEGRHPVTLGKGSTESVILRQNLQRWPEDKTPQLQEEGDTAIYIPTFKRGPDPRYYNYLPPRAMQLLIDCIRNNFRIQFGIEMSVFVRRGKEQQDAVYAYMERHNIEQTETNFLALIKIFQRARETYLQDQRRAAKKSGKNEKKTLRH